MTTPEFRCDLQPDRERVIVRPTGELDLATVPILEQSLHELRAAGFRLLVLDLRAITFMDSTGLRLLLGEAQGAAQDGYELEIVAESEPVQRLLALTGAATRLPIVDAHVADAD
jgi:anti-sigma B factor antagonist